MVKIFCTGSSGFVASGFKKEAISLGYGFYGMDLHGETESVDILDKENLLNFLKPKVSLDSVLFHFAAATFTGKNLTPEQIEFSKKLNVLGTRNVLQVAGDLNLPLVHISTDFVFSGGHKRNSYLPTDPIAPDDTVYSQTKAEAEQIVLSAESKQQVNIVRIAFPYGNMQHPKQGLLRKMLTWMDNNQEIKLYSDQRTCPVPISYLAKGLLKLTDLILAREILSGVILHIVGKPTTPYDFGKIIKSVYQKDAKLIASSARGLANLNMVLDTQDTEKYLGFSAPEHQEEILRLSQK